MKLWLRSGRCLATGAVFAVIVVMTGCAGMQQTMARAGDAVRNHGGTLVGVAAGAAAGALLCDNNDRVKCAVVGGAAGAALGYLWDKRQARLRRIAKQQDLPITTSKIKTFNAAKDNGVATAINDGGMFASGSARLKPAAARKMRALAAAYKDNPQSLLVIGHTDSTGSDRFNLTLSQKRAYTVASLLADQGIDRSRIYFQGVGESQPIASNDTAAGRLANRRVEIVETDSERSIAAYSLEQESDPRFLAYSNKTAAEQRQISAPKPAPAGPSSPRVAANQAKASAAEAGPQSPHAGRTRTASSASSSASEVDFGGHPATSDISKIVAAAGPRAGGGGGLSFIGTARAAEPAAISPCYMNSPRQTAAVHNLASGKALDSSAISESSYWPGLNGNVWLATVHSNLVAVKNLRVMAGSGTVAGQPQVLVYRHYHGAAKHPDYRMAAHTRSYKGQDGVIIRSYFGRGNPMQCMDVVMANTSQRVAKAGVLYYDRGRQLYENDIRLHRLGAND